MSLQPGTSLGPYRIVAPLGAGGMGEVYRAEDTRLGREVAVKVLPQGAQSDPEALARFAREARAVAALSHPNILAIFDVGTEPGQAYAVTELLEGETLRQRLSRGPIESEQARQLAEQLLSALGAAHSKGIVHRDIKPENLFLTHDGQLKVLDFGIARIAAGASGAEVPTSEHWQTTTGQIVGTAAYMAPEQISGGPADARTDLFAFGCVLFEMLTARHPFEADTVLHVAARILRDPAPVEGLPRSFRSVVQRALEKDPAQRFQSAREALGALDALPPSRNTQRLRWPLAAAALGALVVVSVALTWGFARDRRERVESLAVLPLVNLSGDPAQEFFADGMTEAVIADLAQLAALKVISRTSVMQYKNSLKPLPQIARELGVTGIIEGSVRRSGDRVRITAKLIHGPTEQHLWSRSYERDLTDVLALQSDIAQAIAQEVRATVTQAEAERLQQRKQVNPAAFELYLRGRFEWNKRTRESLLRSVELFKESLARDPGYAPAWAGLADARAILRQNLVQLEGGMPATAAAARKAVELDPALAEAHASLGFILFSFEREWEQAGEALRRAVALKPGYASGRQWLGAWLFLTNRREEGLRELQWAASLDPLAPRIRSVYGMYLYFVGRNQEALTELTAAAGDDPQAHMFISDLYLSTGQVERAFMHARLSPKDRMAAQLAIVHAAVWQGSEAERVLRTEPPESFSPHLLARLHAALGRPDEGIQALLQDPEGVYLPYAIGHPELASLRSYPRYREFLKVIHLERYYSGS